MKKSNLLKKAVSVLLVASALAGCGSSATQTATTAAPAASGTETSAAATEAGSTGNTAESGTITMAMVSAWDSIIPFDTTSSYSDVVLDLIYDKLVYLKQDGTYEPRLADKWSMSDDNKVLTVHLNENAKWQDGEPVTADDVVFTMQVYNSPSAAVVRQNNVSPFAGFKEGDDSLQVKAVDEHTVEMTCAEPTNMDFLFFIKFRDIYILPKHLLGDTPYADIRNNSYWEKPVGSGPCIYESQISGERMDKISWGPNWEELLGGEFEKRARDRNFEAMQKEMYGQFENTFMMYLPRLCEHCLNPSCVATCPSGAIYKREEDGIVLIDQDKCRGWRMCISGCPYKKIYFNWKSGKSEKCIFCYPRIESGQPTVCSETCVGRIRYLGVLLYDADRIEEAASTEHETDLYERQCEVFLNPNDPAVIEEALKQGIPHNVIEAAQKSPVYKLAMDWKLALPLHPEYRTLPMVWYVPPLSPIQSVADAGGLPSNGNILPAVESLRIPVQYLANLLSAGDTGPVLRALKRMMAMRHYKRSQTVEGVTDTRAIEEVGLSVEQVEEMYRYLAIANYEDRFVIPTSHRELAEDAFPERNGCGFTFGDGCHGSDTKFNLFNSRRIDAIDVSGVRKHGEGE